MALHTPEMANVCLIDVSLLMSFCVACGIPGGLRVLHAPASLEFAFWEEKGCPPHCTACQKTTLPPCMIFFVPCSCPKPTPYVFRMKTDLVHNISAFRKHAMPFVQVTMRTGTGGRGGGARLRTKGERPGQGGKVVRGFG